MGDLISTLVFRPPSPPTRVPCPFFWIKTDNEGNHIPAFFIRRRGAKVTVLYSHGNSEDLGLMYPRIREMAKVLCVNVMAYDYTGYGKSTGTPSEEMCKKNIDAAYNYLIETRRIPPGEIVLYGRSLGSGPSCYLAAKTAQRGRSVGGVILHSAFSSIFRVAMDVGFTMSGDMFVNLEYAPNIRCPVLIIHGTEDEIVPFSHGKELYKALPISSRAMPFYARGMQHNNIDIDMRHTYIHKITDYLNRYIPAARRNNSSSSKYANVSQEVLSFAMPHVLRPIDHRVE